MKDNIFREYDLRGIVGDDLTANDAFVFGQGFGSFLQDKSFNKVIVGRDNRLSSNYLANMLIDGLLNTGIDVIDLGLVTTPMLNFARKILNIDASVMVTASHNPKEYNGFKISYDHYGQAYGKKIQDVKDYIDKGIFKSGKGYISKYNIENDYLDSIKQSINIKRSLKVVLDCGNGTGSVIAKKMYDMFDLEVEYLYCESDGNFPNHHPDPNVEEYMRDLEAKVKELNYDVGIGIDGDADRVAIVDNLGNYMTTDYHLILMSKYLKPSKILYDVKSSKVLKEELEKLNIEPVMCKTGAAILNTKMQQENFNFGGEFSGHLFYLDKWYGFDDGLYAGLRFLEMLSNQDKPLSELLRDIKKYPSTYFNYPVADDMKFEVVEKVKHYLKDKGYKFYDIDGVRVEQSGYMILIRASNTTPNLTLRFEAETIEELNKIKKVFVDLLDQITNH